MTQKKQKRNRQYTTSKKQKLSSEKTIKKTALKQQNYSNRIADKSIARTRQDIGNWNTAISFATKAEKPKRHLLHNLYNEIRLDALLTSQIENRRLKALKQGFSIKDAKGNVNEQYTELLNNSKWATEITRHILNTRYYGHSLVELSFNEKGEFRTELIPRQNVDPKNGFLYFDYSEDKGINYRNENEYGIWLLEFGENDNLGLLNNAVPHVLFKRFAQSCWSELCEIYGIPPRVLTTNTHDPTMVSRGERMMQDMGAAAWFIIDDSEKFEWAKGVSTNGDVYQNLINLCNNENSLLISGAVIGQDTTNGSYNKDESAQNMLHTLVASDLEMTETLWNNTVIPALISIGILPEGSVFMFEQSEDIDQLWDRTKEALPYFNVNAKWVEEKFGIKIDAARTTEENKELKLSNNFFV